MKKNSIVLALILVFTLIGGCAKNSGVGGLKSTQSTHQKGDAQLSVSSETYPLTVTDYLDYQTKLEKLPARVAVLAGTPLNIWYDLGGKSICSSEINDKNIKLVEEYKEEMKKLPAVGAVYSLDMEAVVNQKPDLVILQSGVQSSAAKTLRDMKFPVITTLTRSFDDVVTMYRVFGVLLNKSELAEEKIKKMTEARQYYIDKAPEPGKKVVMIYLTANSLSVKLDNSIAGYIAKDLKLKNIASGLPADTVGSENTPLDIEYIVKQDPDIILVTSMIGSNELAMQTMKKHFDENQAWQSVSAVREGKIIYLPQEYFLYNGGPYYVEAVKYMAMGVYPEIFGELK